ncbi:hypothetical protein GCM10028791_26550 [Echinicola sediminis]
MKKIGVIVLTILVMGLAQSFVSINYQKDNHLSQKQKADGWEMLFDGKSLDGWSKKSGFATYKVEKGNIVGTTVPKSPNTFLCSDKSYADFELTFDVKYDQSFNSGVQIRAKLKGNEYGGRVYGPQVEIEESPGQAGFIYGEAAGGWQSTEPNSKDPDVNSHSYFKNDEWNHYRVLAQGRNIKTWINGNLVADLDHDPKRYEDNSEGFIGLQVHGVGNNPEAMSVRWKNIYIRSIK